jgi:hypothetical protein
MDTLGDHAMVCRRGGDLTKRHDRVRDLLLKAAHAAGIRTAKENPRLLPSGGLRPGDITTVYERPDVHLTAYDVSIRDSLRQNTLNYAAARQGYAAKIGHDAKLAKYRAVCSQADISFQPLVWESTGGATKEVHSTVRRWTDMEAERSNASSLVSARHRLYARISIAIQEENARAIYARLPSTAAALALSHDLDDEEEPPDQDHRADSADEEMATLETPPARAPLRRRRRPSRPQQVRARSVTVAAAVDDSDRSRFLNSAPPPASAPPAGAEAAHV